MAPEFSHLPQGHLAEEPTITETWTAVSKGLSPSTMTLSCTTARVEQDSTAHHLRVHHTVMHKSRWSQDQLLVYNPVLQQASSTQC